MMDKKLIYHSTCFDQELLRRRLIMLNDNSIDYRTIDKSTLTQSRAPLSGYFEVEIHIGESDFDKACKLLIELNE